MQRLVVAVALVACRGDHEDAGRQRPASAVSAVVPKLPQSDDGAAELRAIDKRIEIHRDDPHQELPMLLERATYRGHLEDYQEALARSAAWVAAAPTDVDAWVQRVRALTAVHKFAEARVALDSLRPLATDPNEVEQLATTIDEATGQLDRSAKVREADARRFPNPMSLTRWAQSLALTGELDHAIALIPRAAATIHDNTPELLSWLLFAWGRLYEQKAEPAAARQLFEAARARMPAIEPTTHLAQAMIATGDAAGAKRLVEAALVDNRHPELLALAAQLDPRPERVAAARAEWERYLAALPEAFGDHAARFYLAAGANPARALELADGNLANRDTREARALVVEAALAADKPDRACAVVEPLVATAATHAQRFLAWRALARCGRATEADRLAGELGITGPTR